ncbi:AraC family transcriptional regulator [Sinimarinibacterium thermocellulolyticum]|uniref:AraC family transcriptional regulator n=1 Tax=Sinimarinibacterium thermocellulolyticum TaxID=3170016 RepID=A0ABV2AFC6_9GAMM
MTASTVRRSVVSAQLLARIANERGLPLDACLRGTQLDAASLLDPATEITADQELRLIRNILEGLGDPPGLGLDAGLRYHLSSYGIWGFALLSSPTFRSAAQIAVRYLDLSYAFARYRLENRGRDLLIVLDDSEVPDDVRQFLVERDFAAWANAAWEMRPGGFPAVSAQFRFARPDYAWRFDRLCGVRPSFGAALNATLLLSQASGRPVAAGQSDDGAHLRGAVPAIAGQASRARRFRRSDPRAPAAQSGQRSVTRRRCRRAAHLHAQSAPAPGRGKLFVPGAAR